MDQLVIDVEGAKTINFELLKGQYGFDLVKELKWNLGYVTEKQQEWKLKVVAEGINFITFAFVTKYDSYWYEVSKRRKVVDEKYIIGRNVCREILKLMESIEA